MQIDTSAKTGNNKEQEIDKILDQIN